MIGDNCSIHMPVLFLLNRDTTLVSMDDVDISYFHV